MAKEITQINQYLNYPGGMCRARAKELAKKPLGSRYVSGRSRDWLKFKNPSHPAVQREFEEDWGKTRRR
jgi:hypothetical protein